MRNAKKLGMLLAILVIVICFRQIDKRLQIIAQKLEGQDMEPLAVCLYIHQIEKVEEEIVLKEYNIPLSKDLQQYIIQKSKEANLDPKLILAIIKVESNFNPEVISKTNDYGLMQINKINHDWLKNDLGITDFLDPYQSIDCGIYILADIATRYEDEHMILTAYNWGEYGSFKNWKNGENPTSSYSRKVKKEKERLEEVVQCKNTISMN